MNQLTKGILVLACVVILAAPALAGPGSQKPSGGGGGGGSTSGCATLDVGLSTSYATAGVSTIGVYGPVTNCSGGRARYTVVDSITSACGVTSTISSGQVSFSGPGSTLVSTSYPVPSSTCAGTATVTRRVYAGSVVSDSASVVILH